MTTTLALATYEHFTYHDRQGPDGHFWRTLCCAICRNSIHYRLEGQPAATQLASLTGVHVCGPIGFGWNGLPMQAISVQTFDQWTGFLATWFRDLDPERLAMSPQSLPTLLAIAEIIDSQVEAAARIGELPSLTCPVCRVTTYTPSDVSSGYCGRCEDYTTPQVATTFTATTGELPLVTAALPDLPGLTVGEIMAVGRLPSGAVGVRWITHEQCATHAVSEVQRTMTTLGPDATGLIIYENRGEVCCGDCVVAQIPVTPAVREPIPGEALPPY